MKDTIIAAAEGVCVYIALGHCLACLTRYYGKWKWVNSEGEETGIYGFIVTCWPAFVLILLCLICNDWNYRRPED